MFNVDTGIIFWTIVSFVIMAALLYRLVFPPLVKILEQRRSAIEGGLKQAKAAQEEAQQLLVNYRQQLADAEGKTSAMFEEAQNRSQAMREEALKNAQKEANRVIESTRKDIEVYERKALTDLKDDISRIVINVSGRMIKKNLKAEDQKKLIDASIKEMEKNAKRAV